MIVRRAGAKMRLVSGALAAAAMWPLVSGALSAQTNAAAPDLNQLIAQLKGDQWANPAARSVAARALTSLAGDSEATPAPVRNAARDALLKLGFGQPARARQPAGAPEQAPASPLATPPSR